MDVEAIDIFKEVIGKKLKPLIVCYNPYTDHFKIYPYRHTFDPDFEKQFVDILFDTIIFYAYEKSEIEKEYTKEQFKRVYRSKQNLFDEYEKIKVESYIRKFC